MIVSIFSGFLVNYHDFSEFSEIEFSLKTRFCDRLWFYGAGTSRALTDGQTSRKRGRVQQRAGGREAETYPAFGGALAHPPELQLGFLLDFN